MLSNISILLSIIPIKIASAEILFNFFKICFCLLFSGSGNLGVGELFIMLSKVLLSISFKSTSCFALSTTSDGERDPLLLKKKTYFFFLNKFE